MKTDFNTYDIRPMEDTMYNLNVLTGILEIVNPNLIIPDGVNIISRRLEISDKDKDKIESIIIPESVKKIDYKAFVKCKNLQSVTIKGNNIEIGEAAFFLCDSLEIVNLPEKIDTIGDCAFENCKKLNKIVIPADIKHIGYFVFNGIENINIIYKGSKENLLKIDGGKDFLEFYPQMHTKDNISLDDLIEMGKSYGEINKILKGEIEL